MKKIELTRQNKANKAKQDKQGKTRQTRQTNVHRRVYYVVHCHVDGIDLDIYHAMLWTHRKTNIPHHEIIIMQLSQLPKKQVPEMIKL
jgi:hypothetical protein